MNIRDMIIKLTEEGVGAKRIAARLGITEWRVRTERNAYNNKLIKGKSLSSGGIATFSSNKVKTSKRAATRAVVLSDIHIPYQDTAALSVALAFMKNYKPDNIVLNGDIIDFYPVSSFSKDPLRIDTLQDEVDDVISFLRQLKEDHPKAGIDYVKGNHEDRLERFLTNKAPALSSLNCLSIDELLDLGTYGISFYDESVYLGELEVTHGYLVRKNPGASAKAVHEKTAKSILIGHVHRLNKSYMRNKYGQHLLIENGCLSSLEPDYTRFPNWQHGFTTVEYDSSGELSTTLHHIEDGVLLESTVSYSG